MERKADATKSIV